MSDDDVTGEAFFARVNAMRHITDAFAALDKAQGAIDPLSTQSGPGAAGTDGQLRAIATAQHAVANAATAVSDDLRMEDSEDSEGDA